MTPETKKSSPRQLLDPHQLKELEIVRRVMIAHPDQIDRVPPTAAERLPNTEGKSG